MQLRWRFAAGMKLAQDLGVLDDGIPYAMAFKCVAVQRCHKLRIVA
jgi:hypothetical protein